LKSRNAHINPSVQQDAWTPGRIRGDFPGARAIRAPRIQHPVYELRRTPLPKLSEKSQKCSWRSPTGCREASFGPITCSAYRPNSRLERFSNPFRTVSPRTRVYKTKKRGRPPPRYAARPAVKIPPGRGAGAASSRTAASGAVLQLEGSHVGAVTAPRVADVGQVDGARLAALISHEAAIALVQGRAAV
jgi:hypothetical protein